MPNARLQQRSAARPESHDGGWSAYWCRKCDAERISRIDKSLNDIGASMPTKTRGKKSYTLAEKKPENSKDLPGQTEIPPPGSDPNEHPADKLKKIRSARRIVKQKEIELGRAHENHKIAKEELSAAVSELCRIIDGSTQIEMSFAHLDKKTGELETDEDLDATKVEISAGGKTAKTTLGGLKRATEALAGKS